MKILVLLCAFSLLASCATPSTIVVKPQFGAKHHGHSHGHNKAHKKGHCHKHKCHKHKHGKHHH